MTTGFVQVAPDSTGKQLDNDVIQIPAGTIITDGSGNQTVLSAPAYYFRERVVNADPNDPQGVANVRNASGPNPNDYGLTVRLPQGQADLQTLAGLLLDIDTNIAQLTQALTSGVPPTTQFALPVAGMPPGVLSPTVPRALIADQFGRQIIVPYATREAVVPATLTITSSTSAQNLLTSTDPNVFNDLFAILLTNTSATATEVDVSDGTNTYAFMAPATDMRGFTLGGVIAPQPKTANTWTVTTIASVASLKVSAWFVANRAK